MRLLSGFCTPLWLCVLSIYFGIATYQEASAQVPVCVNACKRRSATGLCCRTSGLSAATITRCASRGCKADFEEDSSNVSFFEPVPLVTPTPAYSYFEQDFGGAREERAADLFHAVQASNYNKLKGALDSLVKEDSSAFIKKYESSPYHFGINNIPHETAAKLKTLLPRDISSVSPSTIQATLSNTGGGIQGAVMSKDLIGSFINPQQWGLRNLGGATVMDWDGRQYTAQAGVDISAVPGWSVDLSLGTSLGVPKVVAAVIDDGFELKDADYVRNLYTNAREVPCNGKDDDNNGFVDDYQGWDSVLGHGCKGTGALRESVEEGARRGHGTHVASILASTIPLVSGNASIGMAPGISVLPIKAYREDLGGYDSESLIEAYRYILALRKQGVNVVVVNTSYTAPCAFVGKAERESIEALVNAGIAVVGAAGNAGASNDTTPMCPGNLGADNRNPGGVQGVLSIANASPGPVLVRGGGSSPRLHPWSNFGRFVNTAAPGTVVFANNEFRSGTSMAAPFVSGVVALMRSVNPFITPAEIEQMLSGPQGTKYFSLPYPTRSGGMVSAFKAVKLSSTSVVAGKVVSQGSGIRGAIVTMTTKRAGQMLSRGLSDSSGNFFFRRPPVGEALEIKVEKRGLFFPAQQDLNNRPGYPPRLIIEGEPAESERPADSIPQGSARVTNPDKY